MTDIPPPRYKIVEHKGRITVTDTWADGGRPSTPHASMPTDKPRQGDKPRPGFSTAPSALVQWRTRLVELASLGKSDAAGRPVIRTSVHIDEKGSRSIALSEAGEERLGNSMIAAVALGVVVLVLLYASFITALVVVGVIGMAVTSAKTTARPKLTKWLDSLGETLPG